jgi:hypothetical protein
MEITGLVDAGRLLLQAVAPVGKWCALSWPTATQKAPARDILAWFRNRAGRSYVGEKWWGGVRHDKWLNRIRAWLCFHGHPGMHFAIGSRLFANVQSASKGNILGSVSWNSASGRVQILSVIT